MSEAEIATASAPLVVLERVEKIAGPVHVKIRFAMQLVVEACRKFVHVMYVLTNPVVPEHARGVVRARLVNTRPVRAANHVGAEETPNHRPLRKYVNIRHVQVKVAARDYVPNAVLERNVLIPSVLVV